VIKHKFQCVAISALVAGSGMSWVLFCGGLEAIHEWQLNRQKTEAAEHEVVVYELRKKSDYRAEQCAQASQVAIADEAGDKGRYRRWKEIEAAECKSIGMPVLSPEWYVESAKNKP
jgi:hypothetical protein